jgi:hypothetical protein
MLVSIEALDCGPWLIEGLNEVAEKTGAEWSAQDILEALQQEKLFLFMDPSDSGSFVVLSQYKHPYLKESVLVCEAAYNKTGDAIAKYQPQLEKLAKAAESSYLEFSSPRSGFKRVAETHGYETVCTTYRKKL